MDAVKSFNAELAGLYECKPPISKAKMTAITKGAIRAIKFYKHVVQSVEKFIQKCKTEYKIPGLYVIDSIVRQSRHQFGIEKDVFAPRFAKNILITFYYLFKCPQEDKSKVIRVLNLWQKNQVFAEEVIQPLFDLADPNHPIQKEVSNQIAQKASKAKVQQHPVQEPPQVAPASAPGGGGGGGSGRHDGRGGDNQMNNTSANMPQQVDDECKLVHIVNQQHPVPVTSVSSQVMSAAVTNLDPSLIQQIQQILMKQPTQDDGTGMAAAAAAAAAAGMVPPVPDGIPVVAPPVPEEVKGQGIPGLTSTGDYDGRSLPFLTVDTSQPPPGYIPPGPFMGGMPPAPMAVPPPTMDFSQVHPPPEKPKSPREEGEHSDDSEDVKEIHHEDHDAERRRSRSRSRSRSRRRRRTRSRSRSRSRSRHRRSRSRSRGRRSSSRSRRRRSRSRERDRDRERDRRDRDRDRDRDREREKEREKEKLDPEKEREREKEREKERERKKRGLPPCKKEHLSVCSTTLWVGHLSKLVHQEELSDTFGEYGDIVSIDLIPPRGCAFICMNRRQDAARALSKLKSHKMHNKAITLAWAPGKGVKGKEFKDYWEVEVGCSYIPFHKLITMSNIDLDNLEEGGMIDEETVPDWLRGRYGLEGAPPGPPPGFVPIGVPPGHPPNTRSQEIVAPLPPMPPPPPVEKPQEVPREGPPPLPTSAPGLPPNMMPPPFGLPNMPPPQVGHGPGPGGMPPLPQGFVPPNLPPMGVPPPMGLPPLGVHPPVSSILGQPLIGAMPPPVSMAPSMPNRPPLMPPGSEMQNNVNSGPITTMANSGHMGNNPPMVNNTSHSHESNDMDIEMEDVEKNDMGKENGLPSKEKDDHNERQHDRQHRFDRSVAHSSPSGEDKMGLVERLRNLASGGDMEPRDKYDRERRDRDRDRDRDRGREVHERDERIHDRDRDLDMRGRENKNDNTGGDDFQPQAPAHLTRLLRHAGGRFGPDAFSGPPPGFPPPGTRPDGPPNFRPDGSTGPNGPVGPNGPGGPGGFNNFVPVPGFGPPGGGTGGPPGLMGGPPGPHGHAGIRNDGYGHMRMGMMAGPNGPGFGPRPMHGPGGFNGPRGLLGPPPMGMGPLMGSRPPLLGDMPGGPNGSMGLRGPGGMPGPRPGMWMEGPGPRFQGHDVPHGGPPGSRDGLPDRPWETDRSREGDRPPDMDRFRDGDRSRDDDRPHDMDRDRGREDRSMDRSMDDRPMDDRPRNDRSRDDRSRDDRPRDDRPRDDRSRDDRSRDDRSRDDRSRDDRSRDDRTRDDRSREDRSRDDRSRDDRSRDDRSREDRSRDDRSRDDRSRNDRSRDDRSRDDRSRDDRSRDDRSRDDRSRDDRSRDDRSRDDRSRSDRSRGDRSRDDRSRDDRSRDDRSREDRPRDNRYRDDRSRDDRSRDDRIRDNDRSWDSKSRDDRRRDDKRSWEKPRWGSREEEEPVVQMEDGEPGSWDVWAMMSAGDYPLPKLGVKEDIPNEEKLGEDVKETVNDKDDKELPKEQNENLIAPKKDDKELKHDVESVEHKQEPLNDSARMEEENVSMEVESAPVEVESASMEVKSVSVEVKSASVEEKSAPMEVRTLPMEVETVKELINSFKSDEEVSISKADASVSENDQSTVNTQLTGSLQEQDPAENDKPEVNTPQDTSMLQEVCFETDHSTGNTKLNRSPQQDDLDHGHSKDSSIFQGETTNDRVKSQDHKSHQPELPSFSDDNNWSGETCKAECSKSQEGEDNVQQGDSKQDKLHQENSKEADFQHESFQQGASIHKDTLREESNFVGLSEETSSGERPSSLRLERESSQRGLHVECSESEELLGKEECSTDFTAAKANNSRVVGSPESGGSDNQEEQGNAYANGDGQANEDTEDGPVSEKEHEDIGGEDNRDQDNDNSQLNED